MADSKTSNDILDRIFADPTRYTCTITGSWFNLKDARFPPWSPYTGSEGRFHSFGTGSVYVANSLATCAREVGWFGKVPYELNADAARATNVLDLEAWSHDNSDMSASILVESGSGGYEPTQEISNRAWQDGFHGIRYPSRHGAGGVNTVLWMDRVAVDAPLFRRIETAVAPYVDVTKRTQELGLTGSTELVFLPRNFDSSPTPADLVAEATTVDVRRLLGKAGVVVSELKPESGEIRTIHEKSAEWVGPIIFVSGAFLTGNTHVLSVALGVIGNYLTDFFKGSTSADNVAKLSVVLEKGDGTTLKIDYKGPPNQVQDLARVVEEVNRGK